MVAFLQVSSCSRIQPLLLLLIAALLLLVKRNWRKKLFPACLWLEIEKDMEMKERIFGWKFFILRNCFVAIFFNFFEGIFVAVFGWFCKTLEISYFKIEKEREQKVKSTKSLEFLRGSELGCSLLRLGGWSWNWNLLKCPTISTRLQCLSAEWSKKS